MSTSVQLQPSTIELSYQALSNNIAFLKSKAGSGVQISSVIKGNAYGHGIKTYLPMAESCGLTHFSVFSADEAEKAMKARKNPDSHVMIMGMIPDDAIGWAIEKDISFYVFDMGRLEAVRKAAIKLKKKARVHLQLETGMNRVGIEQREYEHIIQFLLNNREFIQIEGICTHFAGAESVDNFDRIQSQKVIFRDALIQFRAHFPQIPYIHAASSAALLTYPETIYNMVRVGIAQYGFWPSREVYMHLQKNDRREGDDPLQRVMRWRSSVMSVKSVDEGKYIGYGKMYKTTDCEKIATVPVGYTHGFGRNLTNSGYVLVNGKRSRVVGLVNMNMITIDVTNLDSVDRGDEVVMIGKQNGQEITVASFGEMSNNLNYEVLARLPAEIPRKCIWESNLCYSDSEDFGDVKS
jgi:alanine racemase